MAAASKPVLALDESAGYCGVQESIVGYVLLCVQQSVTVWVPVDMAWVSRSWHFSPWAAMIVGDLFFIMV